VRPVAAAALAGAAVFLGSCSLPLVGLWDHSRVGDIRYYHRYGELVRHHEVPYRDFYLEYPPGALPVFVAPTVAGPSYGQAFRLLAALLGAATVPLLALTLRALGTAPRRIWAACVAMGLAPLALGPVYVLNFDSWPVFLTAVGVALLAWGRRTSAAAVLGLAFVTKVYPVVLLPVLLVRAWRAEGVRAAVREAAAFAIAAGAVLLPLGVLAPGGVGYSLYVQAKRPLQVESLGASVLLVAHQLGLYGGTVNSDYNSQNLSGSLAEAFAAVTALALLAALCWVWLAFARGRLPFTHAAAASVVAFVAFGKVLSPQYLIWLVPLVLLVDELLPAALLAVALVLTHLWFPGRYEEVVSFRAEDWLVFARDLTLVAVFAALAAPAVQRTKRAGRLA
jgi:uncharacterized membrane protein